MHVYYIYSKSICTLHSYLEWPNVQDCQKKLHAWCAKLPKLKTGWKCTEKS